MDAFLLARIQFGDMQLIGHYGSTAGYNGFMLQDTATGAVFVANGFHKTLSFVHGSQGCVAYYRS